MITQCKECGGQVSSEAKCCPHCGYKQPRQKKANNYDEKNAFAQFFKFDWVNDVGDWLSDIPIIGGCLTMLFVILLVGGVIAAVVFALIGLWSLSPRLGIIVFAIGFAVLAYFATYKWHARRRWMFWLALPASIAMIILAIVL